GIGSGTSGASSGRKPISRSIPGTATARRGKPNTHRSSTSHAARSQPSESSRSEPAARPGNWPISRRARPASTTTSASHTRTLRRLLARTCHTRRVSTAVRPELPALPLAAWQDTKTTLHLWAQIVGKVRLASTSPRNHWWNVTLYVDVRGLTTRRMHAANGVTFEIAFDFVDHRLLVATNGGAVESFDLVDGLSVAAFDAKLHEALRRL